jgi:hypothetical protein
MPYLDVRDVEAEVALLFIQTVRGNMEGYTQREVKMPAPPARPKPCWAI